MNKSPDLFIQLGDIHYSGTNSQIQSDFEYSYHELLHKNPTQSPLYTQTPFSHTFDDHDFGSNNANSSSPSSPNANSAYRSMIR